MGVMKAVQLEQMEANQAEEVEERARDHGPDLFYLLKSVLPWITAKEGTSDENDELVDQARHLIRIIEEEPPDLT